MRQRAGTRKAATGRNRKQKKTTVIACEACLDVALAHDLSGRLRDALKRAQPVKLEAARVERVDTAVLQLLCAFFREARAHGLDVQWHQPSPALRHAARLLDLTAALALPDCSQDPS